MDEDLDKVRAALAGDRASFRGLVERYRVPVVRFARNLLQNREEAEDLAQDVFLAAFHHLRKFDPARGRFSTWLFTLARNRCWNELRKERPARVPLDDALPGPEVPIPSDTRAMQQRLDQAFAALPVALRTAFLLAEVEELAYPEIARIEGVPLGTVKSRIHRARERLRGLLEEVNPDVRGEL